MAKVKKGLVDLAVFLQLPTQEVAEEAIVQEEVIEVVEVPKNFKVYRHTPYSTLIQEVGERRDVYGYKIFGFGEHGLAYNLGWSSRPMVGYCLEYCEGGTRNQAVSAIEGREIASFDTLKEARNWVVEQPKYGGEKIQFVHHASTGGWGAGGMDSGRWRD